MSERRFARDTILLAGLVAVCVTSVGCGKKDKKDVQGYATAQELYDRGNRHLAERDLSKARRVLEQVYYTPEDRARLEPLVRLRIADAVFYQGTDLALIDARSLYLDFVTLYGDHSEAPYAQFQAGVSSLGQGNDPTRDQSQTLRAIQDFRVVLDRFPDSRYAIAARDMIGSAESKLAEHEFVVGRFYMKKKAWEAAANRFKVVVERYPSYRDKDKLYFNLGKALIRGNSAPEGRIYLDKLLKDYPKSDFIKEANALLAEKPAPDSAEG